MDRKPSRLDEQVTSILNRSKVRFAASTIYNRYGCGIVDLETLDGRALGEDLIRNGLAIVDPPSARADHAVVGALLALEDEARRAGLGIWRDASAHPKATDDLSAWIGGHQLVEGRVRRVSENDRYLYLNFGDDWRTDFTVRLRRKLASSHGLDQDLLTGQKLRIRGVLQESRGPLIDIVNTQQIEFLP